MLKQKEKKSDKFIHVVQNILKYDMLIFPFSLVG